MQYDSFLRFVSLTSFASLKTLPSLPPDHSRLFLCRHGETNNNKLRLLQGSGVDVPLNPAGRAQAAQLAQSLSALPIDLVVSSPLGRAKSTADFIAAAQKPGIERSVRHELSEQSFGSLEGMPMSECKLQLDAVNAAWQAGRTDAKAATDGESLDDVWNRARGALWDDGLLGSRVPGRQVAVVAHSTFNKLVLSQALGRGLARVGEVRQALCCINVLDVAVDDGKVTVVATNIRPESADVTQLTAVLSACRVLLLSGQRGLR